MHNMKRILHDKRQNNNSGLCELERIEVKTGCNIHCVSVRSVCAVLVSVVAV